MRTLLSFVCCSILPCSVGGYDGQNFLNTVECYDPSGNQWFVLNSMTFRRSELTSSYAMNLKG